MTGHEEEVGACHYPGDDPRPTSKRELVGWYCYGWAAEVFTVCAMGTYTLRCPHNVKARPDLDQDLSFQSL